jgi:serine/threonine-protein kinase
VVTEIVEAAPVAAPPLEPGDTFDRYVIEDLLGEGGMGQVFRAFDARLDRHVALKIVRVGKHTEGPGARDASRRLVREARAAAAFNHPNVVAVYDVGEVEGQTFIAMELVEGKPLSAFVGDATVSLDVRVRWLAAVARALAAAHEGGLVHRDVKPGNVMVREDGVVKVLDFGIARRADMAVGAGDATLTGNADVVERVPLAGPVSKMQPLAAHTAHTALTADGAVVGTPLYMAPEQMRGEPLDGRADQFAWGVLAYELLAGRKPWGTKANLLTLASTLSKPPPPLRSVAADVPPELEACVATALSSDRTNRHASMEDVVAVLEKLTGESTSARTSSETARGDGSNVRVTPGRVESGPLPLNTARRGLRRLLGRE